MAVKIMDIFSSISSEIWFAGLDILATVPLFWIKRHIETSEYKKKEIFDRSIEFSDIEKIAKAKRKIDSGASVDDPMRSSLWPFIYENLTAKERISISGRSLSMCDGQGFNRSDLKAAADAGAEYCGFEWRWATKEDLELDGLKVYV